METLVHAGDPVAVLREFFRVLKPGHRLVLFEYSHQPASEVSREAYHALERVSHLAAMPGWMRFEDGVLENDLRSVGFASVQTTDVTSRMLPMLSAFAQLGRLPYFVGRAIGKVDKTVNAMSGVEMFRHQSAWCYNITTAKKPRNLP